MRKTPLPPPPRVEMPRHMAQMQRGKLPGGPGSAPPARAASSRPSRQPATASHEPGPGALRLWLRRLGTALGGLVFAAVLGLAWWINTPLGLKDGHVELRFEPGTSPRAVAQALVDAGVDTSPRLLFEWFRWSGEGRRIRAGTYALDAGITPRELLRKLVDGEQVLAKVRFIEGWTFRQLRAELAKAPGLKPESQAMSEAELMTAIGQPGVSPEGRFFPDTYTYAPGSADLQVLKRAFVAMQLRLEATWTQREPDSPLAAPDDLLKLASIVEKESAMAADRGKIAAVFHNRLKIGMPLQTDPTVIYGLGEKFDGNLRKADLQRDTPFNTYLRPGLPPTPIALPGAESLAAAIRPAQSKALYFVARGDGSSEFSETLDQHNRAVSRFQRGGQ